MIATNADKIIAARLKGMRPADMVLVSLDGALKSNNPHVQAKADVAYDWRWVRNLDICLYVRDQNDWSYIAKGIAMQRPDYFGIWNIDGGWGATVYLIPSQQDIGKPVRQWRYELDFLLWMDFQNDDFKKCRIYARDDFGMPYAIN